MRVDGALQQSIYAMVNIVTRVHHRRPALLPPNPYANTTLPGRDDRLDFVPEMGGSRIKGDPPRCSQSQNTVFF
jgi:hypothetical protein